jgi:hypothetical protein
MSEPKVSSSPAPAASAKPWIPAIPTNTHGLHHTLKSITDSLLPTPSPPSITLISPRLTLLASQCLQCVSSPSKQMSFTIQSAIRAASLSSITSTRAYGPLPNATLRFSAKTCYLFSRLLLWKIMMYSNKVTAKTPSANHTFLSMKSSSLPPPAGCPISKPGTLWRLNKTLYGLRQSPRHRYEKFRATLLTMGFTQCIHDPCIFYCTPFPGGSWVYLGMYVNDFVYFSTCPQSELWFEMTLESHLKVDFMRRVTCFLDIYFEWTVTSDTVGVHLSQERYISELLRQNQMEQCNGTATPYHSGLVINRLPTPKPGSFPDPALTKEYQKLMGGYVWLNTSTRPHLCVVIKLLTQSNAHPLPAHLAADQYVLQYLQQSRTRGISYSSTSSNLSGSISYPCTNPATTGYTDANWGPQDASTPSPTDTVTIDECRSLYGAIVTRMGGAISWQVERESKVSRSTCEAKICAADTGCKLIQALHHVLKDLSLSDTSVSTPVFNDNQGTVEWSKSFTNRGLRHVNIRNMALSDNLNKPARSILSTSPALTTPQIFSPRNTRTRLTSPYYAMWSYRSDLRGVLGIPSPIRVTS